MSSCSINYYDLFLFYMSELQNICTNSHVDYSEGRPFPIYDKVDDFLSNTSDRIKGIYVKDMRRYYQGELLSRLKTKNESCALFIIPEFGEAQITTIQFLQNIVISFDSFVDLDPLGERQIQFINWFISKHDEIMNSSTFLNTGKDLYCSVSTITKPIMNQSDQSSAYIRRSIVINARFCKCT